MTIHLRTCHSQTRRLQSYYVCAFHVRQNLCGSKDKLWEVHFQNELSMHNKTVILLWRQKHPFTTTLYMYVTLVDLPKFSFQMWVVEEIWVFPKSDSTDVNKDINSLLRMGVFSNDGHSKETCW